MSPESSTQNREPGTPNSEPRTRNPDFAIRATGVSKQYRLYKEPIDRLKEALHPLKKKYHTDFHALEKVGFEIARGEVVGIIGKNGSGKSTLLKIITGVLTPTEGNVEVRGRIAALLELGAGFNPELSGMDNIYLNGAIMGYTREEMAAKVDGIVAFADIGAFIDQPVKLYSSGMKARLGFAVAINVDPEILIVDEALSVGDVAFQRKCFARIEHFCKDEGKTVLFVSHSESIITQLCDRAIMLHEGEQVIAGDAKMVVSLYAKLMNAPTATVEMIREEFAQRHGAKEETEPEAETKESASLHGHHPELKPQNTVAYPENGARISDVRVTTPDGTAVNVLEYGGTYRYEYTVEFFEEIGNVRFAMLIKTVSGLGLGGKNYPIRELGVEQVRKGEKLRVRYAFKAIMNQGNYFFNCGVNSMNHGIRTVHHRIMDAYLVKVIKPEDDFASGMIDFGLEFTYERIAECN
jgi:lipopolysaccharide transport system ATP-binding protein